MHAHLCLRLSARRIRGRAAHEVCVPEYIFYEGKEVLLDLALRYTCSSRSFQHMDVQRCISELAHLLLESCYLRRRPTDLAAAPFAPVLKLSRPYSKESFELDTATNVSFLR